MKRNVMLTPLAAPLAAPFSAAGYSLNKDRFVVTDAPALYASLLVHLKAITDKEVTAFGAIAMSRLRQDGDDTLAGGVGNDLLDGGAGSDMYPCGRRDGKDTIWSQDGTVCKHDTLKVGAGGTASDAFWKKAA